VSPHQNILAAFAMTLTLQVVAPPQPDTPMNPPSMEFTGTVYDVDYATRRTQVLIKPAGAPEGRNLVGLVKSDAIQDLLESSLIASRPIRVTHYNQNIIRAVLVQTPSLCAESGCVLEVDCSDFECTAVVVGESDRVFAADRRALGILLTAINSGRRVADLILDQNRNITRVKINAAAMQERHP
jgi:hypothetical protein